jgi:hypothetical protein
LKLKALDNHKITEMISSIIAPQDVKLIQKHSGGVILTLAKNSKTMAYLNQLREGQQKVTLPHQVEATIEIARESKKVVVKGINPQLAEPEIATKIAQENPKWEIIKVERIKTRLGQNTAAVTVAVAGTRAPGYLHLERPRITEAYIPQVIQCSKCQRFGHTRPVCQNKFSCRYCAGEHHIQECPKAQLNQNYKVGNSQRSWTNCLDSHSSRYLGCPICLQTKTALQRVATTGMPFKKAFQQARWEAREEK